MRFASPWWLLVGLLVPMALGWTLRRRRGGVLFSSHEVFRAIACGGLVRWHWLPHAVRALALLGLVVALARPQEPNQQTRVHAEGIAIQMVVDTSISMHAPDFELNGQPASRLDAVKSVFSQFVLGDGDLPGRPDDLIGLITFANFPDSKVPLTLSHEVLAHEIGGVKISPTTEGGTNIGDALIWALEDLRQATAKSKIVILMSDGVNEPAEIDGAPKPIDPVDAAQIARGIGIRIYTIGAGRQAGRYRYVDPQSGQASVFLAKPVDEVLLGRIAEVTGGKFFRALDTAGLRDIYSEIDRLERSRTESVVYLDYREWFAPLGFSALVLLVVEQAMRATRWARA